MSTETVKYGRRKGASKEATLGQTKTSGKVDSRQVAVLTANEWGRIKASLTRKQREEEAKRRELDERANLHVTSRNVVKNWENTIEGQRQKKLQAKKIRDEKEEEERKKLDIEEAKYQAQKRKEAIERAKTLQSYQTDRVKGFHGALLLSEVMKERDAQVEYKQRKREMLKDREKYYVEKAKEDYELGLLEEQEKAKQRKETQLVVSGFQRKQFQKRLEEEEEAKKEDMKEGDEIKKDFLKFLEEKKEKEEKRRKNKVELCEALVETIKDKKERELAREREIERHEDEIREFAQAKRRMTKMKRERERELFKQFQDHQEHMVGLLATQIEQKTCDDDKRIAKAVEEEERKREAGEKAKAERFLEQQNSILEHRAQMMSERERAKKEEENENVQFLRQQVETDLKFKDGLEAKMQRQKEEAAKLTEFRRDQANLRKDKETKQKEADLEFYKKASSQVRQEEEEFQRYAEAVIDETKSRGNNVYPLVAAVKAGPGGGRGPTFDSIGGLKPSYQVMDGTGVQMPSYCLPRARGGTHKRMGFTW